MKGIITLEVEIDYATMLSEENLQGVHLFTGATSVEDMIKAHMNNLSTQLTSVLDGKPLVRYSLDGRLRKDIVQEQEQIEHGAELLPEHPQAFAEVIDLVPADSEESVDLINKLDKDIDEVSINLGIPQAIKVTQKTLEAIHLKSGDHEGDASSITEYRGFPVQLEGMDSQYIIVYKTYGGTEIKFFEPQE